MTTTDHAIEDALHGLTVRAPDRLRENVLV
jgi:hypothetical protein